jgi:hypothetical protein
MVAWKGNVMLRLIGGTLAGIIAWIVIVTLLNLGLRHGWHEYAAVEKAMAFTLPMMAARLSISALSSLASGLLAAVIDRGGWAALASGAILLLLFLPVHYSIWDKFPIWYHLTFLISLPLLSLVGGSLRGARPVTA